MRKLIAVCAVFMVPTVANANELYLEGSAGISLLSDVDTKTYSYTGPGLSVSGSGSLEYDESLTFGAEVGLAGIGGTPWRLGASWDHLEAELDQATLSGTVNGQSGSISIPASTLEAAGLDFDNSINVFSGNVYYDVKTSLDIDWYLGGGLGYADIENADGEPAFSAITGINYWFADNFAFGVKYKFTYIDSLEDDLGIEYDSITNHAFLATLSVKFGGTE